MRVVVLAGGVGGSRFVRGVLEAYPDADVDVVVNTADDITLHGLRICPDLDTVMYTLGGGIDPERGWGRTGETWQVKDELSAYGVEPSWFGLGDRDLATHLVRTRMLDAGYPLTEVTAALATRWLVDLPRVRLLPMSDDRVETHVVIEDPAAPAGRRAVHFQEYWVRLRASVPALDVVRVGVDQARPTAAVVEALRSADQVLLAPSNPVVSIGPILAVPGLREHLLASPAPVVGFSGILSGAPVLGMADKLLPAIGVAVDAGAVGLHYGPRDGDGVLDVWVVDDRDASVVAPLAAAGLRTVTADLIMRSPAATAKFIQLGVEALDG